MKLSVDIQIYAEGIAAAQGLKAWADAARVEIMEKYRASMIKPSACYKPPMCGRATISATG